MAQAQIRLDARQTGADLRVIADELRRMDAAKVTRLFRDRMAPAARPVVARVRASALAIPVKPQSPVRGLRAKIAACVDSAAGADAASRQAWVSVYVNPGRMPPGELSLPLYMEGAKPRWRHPVYRTRKNPDTWASQAPHPYFYDEARKLGPAAAEALRRALEDITRQLEGRQAA